MDEVDPLIPGPSEDDFGAHLRVLREAIDVDLDDLARRCRLDVEVLRALEQGEHCPDLDTMQALATGLGLRLDVMFSLWERGFFTPDRGTDRDSRA